MKKRGITISEELADSLRDDIISGKYKPREHLTEALICERYQVSRTPVREAIRQLEAAGLVRFIPYHGAVITDFDGDEIRNIYETRILLESEATRLAVPFITQEDIARLEASIEKMEAYSEKGERQKIAEENELFHRVIYERCPNTVIVSIINDLLQRTTAIRRMSWNSDKNLKITNTGHRNILSAIKEGDARKAQKASMEHIRLYLTQM